MFATNTTRMAAVQAEPVWGDLNATTTKTLEIIEKAADQGVKVLIFPELWLPGVSKDFDSFSMYLNQLLTTFCSTRWVCFVV
jgi:predicted amidohydrolase